MESTHRADVGRLPEPFSPHHIGVDLAPMFGAHGHRPTFNRWHRD